MKCQYYGFLDSSKSHDTLAHECSLSLSRFFASRPVEGFQGNLNLLQVPWLEPISHEFGINGGLFQAGENLFVDVLD